MSTRHVHHGITNHDPGKPLQNPPRRIDRRTLLKATAAFIAMATAAPAAAPRLAEAEDGNTRAADWNQPENIGGEGDYLSFDTEFSFNALAPHWPGDTPFPAAVEISLSSDGQTWSEWTLVGPAHTDAGPPDRDGRIFGELVFSEEASMVRYRGLDADGNVIAIPGLSFTYINAKAGPRISDFSRSSLNPSLTRPPIIAREDWGAERAYGGVDHAEVEWPPSYQTVKHVIIHHSETPRFRDPLVEIRSIHYYHAVTRGWGDIGYNYLVDFMGNVYEGRVGGENAIGGHAFQYAHGSAGICAMGSFSIEKSTPEAIAGLTWITAWAARKLDPLAKNDFHETPNLPTVCGHRDVVNSSCPGDGLYADLPTIRWAVADVIAGAKTVLNDPEFSPGQTVKITVADSNLRTLPGKNRPVAQSLAAGTVMHVIDGPTSVDGYQWYELSGNRGSGWMASSLFTASSAEPPTGKFRVGQTLLVDTDFLNIRQDPSLRSPANATTPYGTRAAVIDGPRPAGGFRWYRLDTSYGKGWAVEQYLVQDGQAVPRTRFKVGDGVAVNDPDGLRLRTGAGTGTSIVRTLPKGTKGVVIGGAKIADKITWVNIQTSLGTGWVGEEYLTPHDNGPSTPSRFERGDTVTIDTDSVNLREAAGTDKKIIRSLGNGIVGRVTDGPTSASNMYWVRIDTDYGIGWVAEAFLAGESNIDPGAGSGSSRKFSVGDNVYVDTDGINLRTSPGTSAKVVTVLHTNETARVTDGPQTADGYVWYKLQSSRGTGWGVSQYLGLGSADPGASTGISIGDTVAVDTDGINLRSTPGIAGSRVKVLYTDQTAKVIDGPRKADGYTWYKLQAGSASGWAVGYYLRKEAGAGLSPGDTARVFDGELNLRSGAGTGNGVVAVLADGAWVEILDGPKSADGYSWVRVKSSKYGSGWCVANFLARS